LAGDGEGALWVCVRCGKHGDGVPLVAVGPTYHAEPAEEAPVAQVHLEAEDVDDGQPAVSPDWPRSWTAQMTDNGADDIIHAADVPQPEAAGPAEEAEADAEPEPELQDRRSQPSVTPAVVAVAVVSLAVAGGVAYMAFRRRRRHR
jgi:hypothetical protein